MKKREPPEKKPRKKKILFKCIKDENLSGKSESTEGIICV